MTMIYQNIATSAGMPAQTAVLRSDGAIIPADENNTDWRAYQAWLAAGNAPAAAPTPAPVVPQLISRRQFFQQAELQGLITQVEALAAVQTGAIPSEMVTLVSGLPSGQQFAAQMLISGGSQFDRGNALTLQLGTAYGWTSAQLDAFWTAARAL